MPWTRITVSNYGDAADKLAAFLTRSNRAGAVTPNVSNTGDGTVFGASSDISSPVEDWTLVCTTNGGNNVGIFSVTGSVSGAQAAATVGVPYSSGLVNFTIIGGTVDFTTATPDDFTFSVAAATANWVEQRGIASTARMGTPTADGGNTGNGTIGSVVGIASDVPAGETWTITATSATNFTVVGSVSGSEAAATVGVAYDNGQFSMLITAGGTPFVSGDFFTMTQVPFEYILKGIGGGTDEIYVGYKEVTNASTYYNWDIQGLTGYVGANIFESQPGYEAGIYNVQTDGSFDILIIENSRRFIVVPIIGSIHAQIYLGWILPVATPSQWDYPLYKGGDSDDPFETISSTADDHTSWWKIPASGDMYNNSNWDENSDVWPYDLYTIHKTEADIFTVTPVTIINKTVSEKAIYGEADGCYYVDADNGAVTVADSLIDSGEFFFITQDVFRVGNSNLMALKLE